MSTSNTHNNNKIKKKISKSSYKTKQKNFNLVVEAESCNSGIPKTETGEFLSVQGQSELQNKHKASWSYYLAKVFFF